MIQPKKYIYICTQHTRYSRMQKLTLQIPSLNRSKTWECHGADGSAGPDGGTGPGHFGEPSASARVSYGLPPGEAEGRARSPAGVSPCRWVGFYFLYIFIYFFFFFLFFFTYFLFIYHFLSLFFIMSQFILLCSVHFCWMRERISEKERGWC